MLRILSHRRQNAIAIFYTLILLFFLSYAHAFAQKISYAELGLQTQRPQSAPSPSPAQRKRGLSQLRSDEAPEGSRVTITYNEPLSDYSAYRSGNQFVVVIPKADAPRIRSGLRGRGFEGVQVEKRGDDTVLSFRIQPGVKARVAQQNNRLEVIFNSPGQAEANTATNPKQAAAAAAVSPIPSGKAPQGKQAQVSLPQPPLANHNSTNADANQTKAGGASGDSSAEPDAATAQTGTSAPVDTSLTPSTEVFNTSSQPPADATGTGKTIPAVAPPRTGFAAARMMMTRHWLPVLIGALLLMSAYGIVTARRRTESNSIPAAHAEAIEGTEAETEALSRVNSAAIANSVEETKPTSITETEMAAETDAVQQVAAEGAMPEAPDATPAGGNSVEQHKDNESSVHESHLINDEAQGVEVEETPEIEAIEMATSQSNPAGVSGVEAVQMLLSEEPAAVEKEGERATETDLNNLSGATESERAAAVMVLANPGSEDAFGKISAAFDDPSQQVREQAARSLFNFSTDRVASFKRIMQESSIERRRKIGAAIASSGMAMEAIKDLTSQSGTKAYEALLVLSLMAKAGEVESLILAIEEHPSTEVRLALVKLLALSGQRDVLSAFRHLATRDSLPIAVRSSIMEAIYQINNLRPFDLSQT